MDGQAADASMPSANGSTAPAPGAPGTPGEAAPAAGAGVAGFGRALCRCMCSLLWRAGETGGETVLVVLALRIGMHQAPPAVLVIAVGIRIVFFAAHIVTAMRCADHAVLLRAFGCAGPVHPLPRAGLRRRSRRLRPRSLQ
jgi:hypothetical protein